MASSASCRTSIKYAKDVPVIKATGERAQHNWVLDEERIAADAAMDGCYCIITSEQEWLDREVIEAYRGLTRIRAHFLVCYVALTVMRLMQADVERATGERPSAAAVAEALRNMTGHNLDANVWFFDYRTDLTDALCDAAGVDLSRQVMTKSQMNAVMSAVKKPRS